MTSKEKTFILINESDVVMTKSWNKDYARMKSNPGAVIPTSPSFIRINVFSLLVSFSFFKIEFFLQEVIRAVSMNISL